MISGVLRIKKDERPLVEEELKNAVYKTDDYIEIYIIKNEQDYENLLEDGELVDIIIIDVSLKNGVMYAEGLRKAYPKAVIIIVAEPTISPIHYMKPTIMAASLILKPFVEERIKKTFTDIVKQFISKKDDEDIFFINTREDSYRIPKSSIIYFESRDKKIFACTKSEEYAFYNTLDNLADEIGEGFVRCHRSFMVNKAYVEKVRLSQNYIELKDGGDVPLSRSYKSSIKEMRL